MTANAPMADERPMEIYEGQFGTFTIEQSDRTEVVLYRAGLVVVALSVAIATLFVFLAPQLVPVVATVCYFLLWAALGLSLLKIHIYLRPLHRTLQLFWAIGGIASVVIALCYSTPLALTAYQQPLTIFGVGFTFAALTGIFVKEAFCFNRLEAKFLVFAVPGLLLGHMAHALSVGAEQNILIVWSFLLAVFAFRKAIQPIPPDIGDKSVFEYLEKERNSAS